MQVNSKIIQTLTDYKINISDGLTYLLSLYYNCQPTFIPNLLRQKVVASGIVSFSKSTPIWHIPLFEGQINNFDWVKEYVAVFKKVNPDVPGTVTECTRRFTRFFAQNPNVTVQDVKNAVNMYIRALNDPKFIMWPHYFISKDKGADKTSMLETYLEKVREEQENAQGRSSITNTMQ